MAQNIYLDLIENPIKRWIMSFCNINDDSLDPIGEHYCLLFPELINGEKKCILFYVDLVYPPFEDELNFPIKKSQYTNNILNATTSYIRKFYESTRVYLLKKNIKGAKLLANTVLGFYTPNLTFAPYPVKEDFIKNNMDLYQECFENLVPKHISRSVINYFIDNKIRLGINIEILEDVPPPKKIIKDLVSNYLYESDSSLSDIDNILLDSILISTDYVDKSSSSESKSSSSVSNSSSSIRTSNCALVGN